MLNADLGYRTRDIIKVWFIRPSSQMSYGPEDQQRSDAISFNVQEAIKASPLFQSYSYGLSPYEIPNDQFNKQKMRIPGENGRKYFM